MTDWGADTNWEAVLDQELKRLHERDGSGEPSAHTGNVVLASEVGGKSVNIGQLGDQIGHADKGPVRLREDIRDDVGALLLPAGSPLTSQFLRLLRDRGIKRVRLSMPEGAPSVPLAEGEAPPGLHTDRSRQLDERLAGELLRDVHYHPVKAWRRPRLPIEDLKAQALLGLERHRATSTAVADVCKALDSGRRMSVTQLKRTMTHFVSMAATDFDLLPTIVAMQRSGDEYLYDHCVNVSMLSMAVATHLQLDRETVGIIGLAGLLQDSGMLRVPASIRLAKRTLTDAEWHEVHRHPLHTLDLLSDLRGLPSTVALVAYQAHERCDGSGYPRQRKGPQVHEYAKIVSLVDSFAAMTSDRPHRAAMSPYEAAKTILVDGAHDRYDRVLLRAFLDTVSLFPIGSHVGLSNGSVARVLRANPGSHTKPVVEELSADGTATGYVIDLSTEDDLRVVRAERPQTPR